MKRNQPPYLSGEVYFFRHAMWTATAGAVSCVATVAVIMALQSAGIRRPAPQTDRTGPPTVAPAPQAAAPQASAQAGPPPETGRTLPLRSGYTPADSGGAAELLGGRPTGPARNHKSPAARPLP